MKQDTLLKKKVNEDVEMVVAWLISGYPSLGLAHSAADFFH
jgi:hypothetical protein